LSFFALISINVTYRCSCRQYADPDYQGGGIGEYQHYNRSSGDFTCYNNDDGYCRAQMDCHLPDTQWQLLGIFKIDNISGGDGWMEQLFKHEGVCVWGWDTYEFASGIRESLPNECTESKNADGEGNTLYYHVKPAMNGNITLGLYTDAKCSQEYNGEKNYNVFEIAGIDASDVDAFNEALDVYKTCQPCIAYNLTDEEFECNDDAGYTNCNQVMIW